MKLRNLLRMLLWPTSASHKHFVVQHTHRDFLLSRWVLAQGLLFGPKAEAFGASAVLFTTNPLQPKQP